MRALLLTLACGDPPPSDGRPDPTSPTSPDDADADGWPVADDCDDGDAGVNPGALETWYDGIDQDCSGGSDFDRDGDGFPVGEDCEDVEPAAFPGHEPLCGDDVDNDCDGLEECSLRGEIGLVAGADALLRGVVPLGAAGNYLATGDVDGDGEVDALVGSGRPMVAWLMYGPFAGPHDLSEGIELPNSLELAVADVNDDGFDDVATFADLWTDDPDPVRVRLGPAPSAALDLELVAVDSGVTVATFADLDLDGASDAIVGTPSGQLAAFDFLGPGNRGIVAIAYGPTTRSLGPADFDAYLVQTGDPGPGDAAGVIAADGDLTGDGLPDLLGYDALAESVYVVPTPLSASSLMADAPWTAPEQADFVMALTAAGDLDGDGGSDLAVGHMDFALRHSVVEVFAGPLTSELLPRAAAVDLEDVRCVVSDGDVDGDGADDLVVSSPNAENAYEQWEGRVYLYYGPIAGDTDAAGAAVVFTGEPTERGTFGASLAVRDVDGDGAADLFVGQAGWIGAGPADDAPGAVFLVHGAAAGF